MSAILSWPSIPQYVDIIPHNEAWWHLASMNWTIIDSNNHYHDVIMGAMASQITSLVIVYSVAYPGADQRKHQSSASLAFERGIHRWPVNSPHKGPVTRKMFPFDDVIMGLSPLPRQAITRAHADLSWMGRLGTNLNPPESPCVFYGWVPRA